MNVLEVEGLFYVEERSCGCQELSLGLWRGANPIARRSPVSRAEITTAVSTWQMMCEWEWVG